MVSLSFAEAPASAVSRSILALLTAGSCAVAQAPPAVAAKPPEAPAAIARIVAKDLLAHATFLASDSLGGRLTGSPGQEEAARYVAAHFAQLGLEPLGDEAGEGRPRGYHQRYGIDRTFVADGTSLAVGAERLTEGFAVLGADARDAKVEGRLRFVAFGRTRGPAAEVGADDSLEGQIAVVLVKPPRGRFDRTLSIEEKFGLSFTTLGQLGSTAANLAKKGAAAVLFTLVEDPFGLADVLNYLAPAPGKDQVVARFPGAEPGMGQLDLARGGPVPTLVLSLQASARVFGELGLDREALSGLLAGKGPAPAAKDDVAAALAIRVVRDADATAGNVVAVLRGGDPQLAREAVVFSAHMDHVGRRLDGEVFNGADDNASGTAGLLAIAQAFAAAETKPRRSVVFLAVSGEELGLWGSQYFVEHPTWPLADVVANVNTDMIGRTGAESSDLEILVTPSHDHASFSTLVQDAAKRADELGLTFLSGDKYYMRSDHYNFARKGVPVVFFCNGEHEDYHQVTDHADKLDGARMERIARLAFWTGWSAANADERPRTLGQQPDWR